MKKLSEPQRYVLEALAADLKNRYIRGGLDFTPSLVGVDGGSGLWRKVHSGTVSALRRRGYIEHFEKEKAPWWAEDYRITEAGLEAIGVGEKDADEHQRSPAPGPQDPEGTGG